MVKKFNITGLCLPDYHYMVDLESRLQEIKALVDEGAYFVVNRARQYGKTTLLLALEEYLQQDYFVINLDFQAMGNASFEQENIFALTFASYLIQEIQDKKTDENTALDRELCNLQQIMEKKQERFLLFDLFIGIKSICANVQKPFVLMIDEIDSATNNQVFLDFLGQLRYYYLRRRRIPAFHSVILAGVYDIKNLKRKIRPEEEHKINSPWNIAAEFNVDMNFSKNDIIGMLTEYEKDYQTGMNIQAMAGLIYDYTAGYPFLVSYFCKIIDEKIIGSSDFLNKSAAWTKKGFLEAEKILLSEKNTLFESLVGKLYDFPELRNMIFSLLFMGKSIVFNSLNTSIDIAVMFGMVKNQAGTVVIANKIFETVFYNVFLSNSEAQNSDIFRASLQDKNQFVVGGHLNMKMVLERFVTHFTELYEEVNEKFLEEEV